MPSKTILFVYPHINSIGGVEMAILNLLRQIHSQYDCYVGYFQQDSDIDLLQRYTPYATVINLQNNKHKEFDIVVYCSLWSPKGIKANKYIRWVHGCVDDMGHIMKPETEISTIVAVGQNCANQIEGQIGLKPIVIHNELDPDINPLSKEKISLKKAPLTLVTVSRISREKGMERMIKISEQLNKDNVNYIWHIVGCGYDKGYEKKIRSIAPKQWVFHGKQENPYPYIKQADYLLQLSDFEAFGYVMLEALTLGTPVITTDYASASELVKHGINGYIVKKDLSDFNTQIFNKKLNFTFEYKSGLSKWYSLLND